MVKIGLSLIFLQHYKILWSNAFNFLASRSVYAVFILNSTTNV